MSTTIVRFICEASDEEPEEELGDGEDGVDDKVEGEVEAREDEELLVVVPDDAVAEAVVEGRVEVVIEDTVEDFAEDVEEDAVELLESCCSWSS